MPRDGEIHGTPEEWLARAKADLVLARISLPAGGRYEDLCYHAQQAAEKAIKAVFRARKLGFTFTHNIGQLLLELADHGIVYPREIEQAVPLTEYAHQTRFRASSKQPLKATGRLPCVLPQRWWRGLRER